MEVKHCIVCEREIPKGIVLSNGNLNQKGNWSRRLYCDANCRQRSWKEYQRKWRIEDMVRNPEKWLRYRKNLAYRRAYKITYEDYLKMHENQQGVCAICKKPETLIKGDMKFDLSVDHNHSTGKIRGLLCSNCNRAIGLLKDDPMVLQSAVDYLLSHMHHGA